MHELPKLTAVEEKFLLEQRQLKLSPINAAKKYSPGFLAHHAPDEPTLIRYLKPGVDGQYTKASAKLSFSLRTDFITSKPGKFLAEYFSDVFSESEIADLAAKHRAEGTPPELKLARTPNEIIRVYANGPQSCMKKGSWAQSINPLAAYASPDLGIAYIERNNIPTARCVVAPDRKIHSRIYGDAIALTFALKAAGYRDVYSETDKRCSATKEFAGCKLVAIPYKGIRAVKTKTPVYALPYGDGFCTVNEAFDSTGKLWLEVCEVAHHKPPHHKMYEASYSVGSDGGFVAGEPEPTLPSILSPHTAAM
jgi:hypothetical protein